jgi:hypothetical protein
VRYSDEEWPHGMRCAECDRLFEDGDEYEAVLHSMMAEGVPMLLVLCYVCARAVGDAA